MPSRTIPWVGWMGGGEARDTLTIPWRVWRARGQGERKVVDGGWPPLILCFCGRVVERPPSRYLEWIPIRNFLKEIPKVNPLCLGVGEMRFLEEILKGIPKGNP